LSKKISIVSPCYNEEENIDVLYEAITNIMDTHLNDYVYEILFIDNYSKDNTRNIIRDICKKDSKVKAIFNANNFGHIRSPFYGMLQADGDAVIVMASDLQDPPSMIIDFIKKWETGNKIVIAKKNKSKENFIMYGIRTIYYKLIKRIADTEQIEHFTGFGLYDQKFIKVLRELNDPYPYFRGLITELGYPYAEVNYTQPRRERGITKNNFYTLYDMAMLGITSNSKIPIRLATMAGFLMSAVSFLISISYLILKLIFWYRFPFGTAPIMIGVFFFGSLQLFFIGLIGEYIININTRVLNRPLVVEEERINYDYKNN
jgi:polyisoprenyl-phosphate glycosyltransferase